MMLAPAPAAILFSPPAARCAEQGRPWKANVEIDGRIDVTRALPGRCPMPWAPGMLAAGPEPFGTMVCAGAVAVP